jgi:hypothetical protein
MNTRKLAAAGAAFTLAAGLTVAGATSASATEGHAPEPGIQDYIAACDVPNRTSQFVLDAIGMPEDVTYTITDGTPANVVTVPAGSTARSAVFSIPASGAHYTISTSAGKGWSFTAAPDCYPVVVVPETTPEVPVEEEKPAEPVLTPEPAPEPPKTEEPVKEEPVKISFTTAIWEITKGLDKDGGVTYDQVFVTADSGADLNKFDGSTLLKCGVSYQVDIYTDEHGNPATLWEDKLLKEGEDTKFMAQGFDNAKVFTTDKCKEGTPPVTTTPDEPVIPNEPEAPVEEAPETPVTVIETAEQVTPVISVVKTVPVAQKAPESLAFTGSDSIYALVSALLMLALGGTLAIRSSLRNRA